MLTGKELGDAIKKAVKLKKIKPADLARHFGVAPPSVQGWFKTGSISKDKLPGLWQYFSTVVGPEHWGLDKYPAPIPHAEWPFPGIEDFARRYNDLHLMEKGEIQVKVREELEKIEARKQKPGSGKFPGSPRGAQKSAQQ